MLLSSNSSYCYWLVVWTTLGKTPPNIWKKMFETTNQVTWDMSNQGAVGLLFWGAYLHSFSLWMQHVMVLVSFAGPHIPHFDRQCQQKLPTTSSIETGLSDLERLNWMLLCQWWQNSTRTQTHTHTHTWCFQIQFKINRWFHYLQAKTLLIFGDHPRNRSSSTKMFIPIS